MQNNKLIERPKKGAFCFRCGSLLNIAGFCPKCAIGWKSLKSSKIQSNKNISYLLIKVSEEERKAILGFLENLRK